MGFFKIWDSMWLEDEKINAMSLELKGAFVCVLAVANKSLDNGRLSFEGQFPRSYNQTLQAAKIEARHLDELIFLNLVVKNGEFYEVKNWKKYQNEYQRQKKYRLQDEVISKGTPEEVEVKKKNKKQPKEEKNNNLPSVGISGFKDFNDWWCKEFQARFGAKYPYSGAKDAKAVKAMLKSYSLDDCQRYAIAGWESRDKWVKGQCGTIAGFYAQIGKIIISCPAPVKSEYVNIPGGLDA